MYLSLLLVAVQVNVWDHAHELARKAEYEQERHAQGLDEATVREDPAWVHNLKIDINELRGNEWKMMLRPEDQDELPLVRPPTPTPVCTGALSIALLARPEHLLCVGM